MKSANPLALALAVLFPILGFVGSYVAAGELGGGFIEGGPYGHFLGLIIWGPSIVGLVACVAIVALTRGKGQMIKTEYPPGEDPRPFTRNLVLLILLFIMAYAAIKLYAH